MPEASMVARSLTIVVVRKLGESQSFRGTNEPIRSANVQRARWVGFRTASARI